MSKELKIDLSLLNSYSAEQKYDDLAEYIKNTFRITRNDDNEPEKFIFNKDIFDFLYHTIQINIPPDSDSKRNLIKELVKALRNYIITPEVQSYAGNNQEFFETIENLFKFDNEGEKAFLQLILQFFNNFVVKNEEISKKVLTIFKDRIFEMLRRKMFVYETSALLYNLSLYNSLIFDLDFYKMIFEMYNSYEDVVFFHFFLEKFVNSDIFWLNYEEFNIEHRIYGLEIINNNNDNIKLPNVAMTTMIDKFLNSNNIIFQTAESDSDDDLRPYEVSLMLDILARASSDEVYLKSMQNDKNFIINAGILLINIHRLGKSSDNYFSTVQKLSEIKDPNEVMQKHPAFGFKLKLIRILGNVCWKNTSVQDTIREAELIPVLLDCCNIDARNPFIMQWVIFAIRNLCENNPKNQEFIAGLHRQGTVSTAILDEMGLTLQEDPTGKSIKVVPLDAFQSKS